MLILRRKIGESIVIGGDIRVTVLKIRDDQVKIGIDAPADLLVLRSELVSSAEQPPTPSVALAHPCHEE